MLWRDAIENVLRDVLPEPIAKSALSYPQHATSAELLIPSLSKDESVKGVVWTMG